MFRKLRRLLGAVVVLAVVVAVGLWLYLDRVAARVLTGGVRYAGEVPCEVDSVHLSVLSGRIEIEGLSVGNPEGFSDAEMFVVGRAEVDARFGSLLDPPVHVRRLEIVRPVVRIEAGRGGTNVSVFMDTVERKMGRAAAAGQVRLLVDELIIRDATVKLGSGVGALSLAEIRLETVELSDLHGTDGQGVTTGELAAAVVLELTLRGVIEGDWELKSILSEPTLRRLGLLSRSAEDILRGTRGLLTGPLRTLLGPPSRTRPRPP